MNYYPSGKFSGDLPKDLRDLSRSLRSQDSKNVLESAAIRIETLLDYIHQLKRSYEFQTKSPR
jgi:hypothetical protein